MIDTVPISEIDCTIDQDFRNYDQLKKYFKFLSMLNYYNP